MVALFRVWWHRNQLFALITGAVIIIIIAFFLAIHFWGLDWTGFGQYVSPPHPQGTDFQRPEALWDFLQLAGVIAIPIAVAWFTTRQSHDLQIAAENQRETALQIYMDKMSELILEKRLRDSRPDDEVRKIARARTLTVLSSLDGNRKRTVVQFLHDSRSYSPQ